MNTMSNISVKSVRIKNSISKVIGLVISLTLAVYLIRFVKPKEFFEMANILSLGVFVGLFSLYLLLNFLRSIRFSILLGFKNIPFKMFPLTFYHNFLVRSLPFYTGDISYVALLRHYMSFPISNGFFSLVSSRIFELFFVSFGGLIGLLSLQQGIISEKRLLIAITTTFLIISVGGLYYLGKVTRFAYRVCSTLPFKSKEKQTNLWDSLRQSLLDLSFQFDTIRNPRIFWFALLLSFGTYATSLSFNLFLLKSLGINHSIGILVIVITLVSMVSWIPFTISGIGVIEGGWSFGLSLLCGLPMHKAVMIGFFIHACQIIAASSCGIIGYILLHKDKV